LDSVRLCVQKDSAPPADLRFEQPKCSFELLEVLAGRERDGMRQVLDDLIVTPALEVDEEKLTIVGMIPKPKRANKRLHELTLSGTRPTRDQTVGPLTHEVDIDSPFAAKTDCGCR